MNSSNNNFNYANDSPLFIARLGILFRGPKITGIDEVDSATGDSVRG